MTSEQEDRRRRPGGILIALVVALVAAWLVFLWLDGSESEVSGAALLALLTAI
ncbi:MAG: hypothetical protein OER12_00825 [Acidimicrobiia bacterium]|nr:hypothetical protein [Acidimicrobiia bacterium]